MSSLENAEPHATPHGDLSASNVAALDALQTQGFGPVGSSPRSCSCHFLPSPAPRRASARSVLAASGRRQQTLWTGPDEAEEQRP